MSILFRQIHLDFHTHGMHYYPSKVGPVHPESLPSGTCVSTPGTSTTSSTS
jgi:hypothetical protein